MRKRKILIAVMSPFVLYFLWLGFLLLGFRTYKSPTTDSKEITGVYHIHTTHSDGRKNPGSIAKIAAKLGLDFIILTDHGNPNLENLESEGWKEGVLVLSGSEFSVDRGHLVGLDFERPAPHFSGKAEEAARQVENLKGYTIIAHPYSPQRPWSWGEYLNYGGIEIINGDSLWRRDLISSLPYLPLALFSPKYLLLKMVDEPRENLKKWDEMNEENSVFGFFASDAHFFYRPLFSLLRLHILLQESLSSDFERAKRQVFKALRQGRFYDAIDAAAQARGFRFWAEGSGKTSQMGEVLSLDAPVVLRASLPYPFAVELTLVHNGSVVYRSREKDVFFEVEYPGVYRAEIFLRERTPLAKTIPWIISNPVYVREGKE